MSDPLRIVVVEDSVDDAELEIAALRDSGIQVEPTLVVSRPQLEAALPGCDVVLTDHSMPGFSSSEVLRVVQSSSPDVPVVIVSGQIGEEAAVAAMRGGAWDYVSKDHLALLPAAVRRAIVTAHERRRLSKAEGDLQRFFNLSRDLFCVLDARGRLLNLNPAWETTFGSAPENLAGTSLLRLAHPADRGLLGAAIDRAADGQPALHVECRLLAQGVERWFVLNAVADARGGLLYAVLRDVTQAKRAEAALLEREEQLHRIVEGVPSGIIMLDRDGRVVFLNAMAARLADRSASLVLGERLDDVDQGLAAALAPGGSEQGRQVELEGEPPRVLTVNALPLRGPRGEITGTLATLTDVTARHRAERALADSEEKWRTLVSNAPVDIFIVSAEGEIEYQHALAPVGATARSVYDAYAPESHPELREAIARVLDTRAPAEAELLAVGAEGTTWHHASLGPVLRLGKPSAVMIVAADITRRKHLEDELAEHRAGLERIVAARTAALTAMNRELEAFSYSVSHDLRAPLRGIDVYTTTLEEDYQAKLDEDGRNLLGRIRRECRQLSGLVSELLALSRVTAGEMERSRVDLSALASDVLAELARRDPARRVEASIQPEVVAEGDPALLRVALENLLGNAWKYSARREVAHISFGLEVVNGERRYVVRDDGAGFDAKKAMRLFAPFQRYHSAKEFEGTGIGLATVQRIVHRHGGRVWAEAEVDKGATFRFTLGEGLAGRGT